MLLITYIILATLALLIVLLGFKPAAKAFAMSSLAGAIYGVFSALVYVAMSLIVSLFTMQLSLYLGGVAFMFGFGFYIGYMFAVGYFGMLGYIERRNNQEVDINNMKDITSLSYIVA